MLQSYWVWAISQSGRRVPLPWASSEHGKNNHVKQKFMSIESEGKCSVSASINMMVCVSVVILKILFCVDGSFCNNNACSYELSSGLNYYTILIVLFIKMFLQMFLFGRLLMWTGNLITLVTHQLPAFSAFQDNLWLSKSNVLFLFKC